MPWAREVGSWQGTQNNTPPCHQPLLGAQWMARPLILLHRPSLPSSSLEVLSLLEPRPVGSALDPPGTLGRLPGPWSQWTVVPAHEPPRAPTPWKGCSGPGCWGLGVPPAVPRLESQGGAEAESLMLRRAAQRGRLALLPPHPALTTLTLEGPALPSALMRRWGGARRPGSRGSSWTRGGPAPGTKGRRMGRMGGQGCRGRREGTLGLSASESVEAECAGSREAALGGGVYRSASWHLQPSQAT